MMYFYYLKPSLQLPKSKSHINFRLILCANNAPQPTHWFIQHTHKLKRFWPMSLALNMSWFIHQMVLNSLLLIKNVTNTGKLAAVSSSILAMVQAFLAEIDLHGCQSITLEAENGKAFLSAVPNKNHLMLIVALTSQEVLLGQLLFSLKRCSENILKADANYTSEY